VEECAVARCVPQGVDYAVPTLDAEALHLAAASASTGLSNGSAPFFRYAAVLSAADASLYAIAFSNFPLLSRQLVEATEPLLTEPHDLCVSPASLVAELTASAPNKTFCSDFGVDALGCKFCHGCAPAASLVGIITILLVLEIG